MGRRSFRIALDAPIDPIATLRRLVLFSSDPTLRTIDGACWNAFRNEDGVVAIRYRRASEREVDVDAWGPGAERAIADAPEHLGVHDRPQDFVTDHPLIEPLTRRFAGLRMGRTGRLFERVVPAIIAQKVTGADATRSWRELCRTYGEPAPTDEARLFVPPTAERLRELAYYDLHPIGLERKRAETILEVARRARRFEALEPEDALRKLGAMRGIGPWTLAHVATAVHGDPDAVPVGDYNLPNLVSHALAGEPRGDDTRMLALLEPFRPHRARVVALLSLGGPSPPRWGPRLSPRDIRRQ